MPYKDPEMEKLRTRRRRAYFREYRRAHPQKKSTQPHKRVEYVSKGVSMGFRGEELALKVLVGSKKIKRPCDLNWEGMLVDVKTAKPTITVRGSYRWKFLLAKQKKVADLYLLIRKDTDDRVIDIHLIPNIRRNNLSFNENTVAKYQQYLLSL